MSRASERRPGGISDEALVDALLSAYRLGAFPMGSADSEEVNFYRPDPRGVLPLREAGGMLGPGSAPVPPPHFHVPRTIEKLLRQGRFEFRCDSAFEAVVRGCALPRRECAEDREGLTEPGTWINGTIMDWYGLLFRAGHAHSVEAWVTAYNADGVRESRLVGGIYGVSIGAAFFGESMFHLPLERRADGSRDPFDGTGAGQACLVVLVRHLARLGYELFDTQMTTGVTRRFGAHEIPLGEYLERLAESSAVGDRWVAR